MKTNFPIKKLVRQTWMIAMLSELFIFIFTFNIANEDIKKAFIYSLIALVFFSLTGFINIGVLLLLERRFSFPLSVFRRLQIFFNIILIICIYIIAVVCSRYFDHYLLNVFNLSTLLIVLSLIVMSFMTLQNNIILEDEKNRSDLENSNLKTANAEAANKLLLQQIHPHFLFNALNTLKTLYKKDPKVGEEYLICLSDFLRASISKKNTNLTRLKDELKLCLDYLEMQKMRFGEAFTFSIAISEEKLENSFMPHFSLQPLLENAIKHNELTEESPLHISIEQEGEWIRVTNNLQLKTTTEGSTGYGLANLAERYRVLSNDELIIEDNGKTFSVMLKILKDENHNNRR
ncbi:MAG: histidine kinase [Rikenellaceae bacterium]